MQSQQNTQRSEFYSVISPSNEGFRTFLLPLKGIHESLSFSQQETVFLFSPTRISWWMIGLEKWANSNQS
jgi:hypothetical protein